MRKIKLMLIILLVIFIFVGCGSSAEIKSVDDIQTFEYKFKPEYSDKISTGIAETFIDFTRDTLSTYLIAFEDFEPTVESEFSDYMGKIILEYNKKIDTYNEHEKELVNLMTEQWDNITLLNMLKISHAEDVKNESMRIQTKYTDEYYENEMKNLKGRVEDTLKKASKFIE